MSKCTRICRSLFLINYCFQDDMMVSDSVKFLVDTMLKNDVENNTASTNTEEIHLSPKTEENILSYCPC